jgi:hypothetical protein
MPCYSLLSRNFDLTPTIAGQETFTKMLLSTFHHK